MPGHECYHCKQWVGEGEEHDCWTTTEAALTSDLSEDLKEAYARLRETAAEFGDQRIYASHHSIMFARKSCYFFVRPKRSFLEVCIFLGRTLKGPQVRKTIPTSKVKVAHLLQIRHRDEVEAPVTDWMREAFELQTPSVATGDTSKRTTKPKRPPEPKAGSKSRRKPTSKSKSKLQSKPRTKSS